MMRTLKISMKSFINTPGHSYASIIEDPVQLKTKHYHDYYELFIVNNGYGKHIVNGELQQLKQGCLVFIRPNDVHYYDDFSQNFHIINVLIDKCIINDLFRYLGKGFEPDRLLKSEMPPLAQMNPTEFKDTVNQLEQLVLFKRLLKEKSDALFRISLIHIITRSFPIGVSRAKNDVPSWLRWLILEMMKKENFTEGLEAMYHLCDKSPEHLSRMCRKYLKKSPTQIINEIRCEYAARLILYTDSKIIDIANDSGFGNPSHFYHNFKKMYNMPPNEYRKMGKVLNTEEGSLIENGLLESKIVKGIPLKELV